ncbi:MAG: major facilitator superfamily 1 [Marmoricola sp.]|nr:major facilitator superfamily 1 [Marmoricola sp.]
MSSTDIPTADPAADTATTPGTSRRWAMLAVSVVGQAASAVMINGPAFLIPTLHHQLGLSLAEAGLVAAASTIGVMVSLIAWGYVADRFGERFAMVSGLTGTAAAGVLATQVTSTVALAVALFLAGCFAASTSSASGRVVVGWFPANRRGLAMGIRQMAQPVGVGIAAITIAVVASKHGISAALWIPTAAAAVAALACLLIVIDPPRSNPTNGSTPNPYKRSDFLLRVHGVSVLLVVPQFAVWTFGLVWLVDDRGWGAGAAGALIAASQFLGAFGRIAVGHLSDLVSSRMRPLRWVAIAAALTMGLLALTTELDLAVAVFLLVVATTVTVADNGLAFTSVAERAGPSWSGRALGVQNTAQYLAASAVAPIVGAAISSWGYAVAFGLAALCPVVSIPLVPVRDEIKAD